MTSRKLSAFIDAIATGRRPKRLRADAEDVQILRVALELRAARPGAAEPSAAFTEGLFRQLSEQAKQVQQPTPIRTATRPRARTALLATAAVAVLVGGTVAATEALTNRALTHSAVPVPVPQGRALRTGSFLTGAGQVLGQIVAYRGDPSWVFMNVAVPDYSGPIRCMLQVEDGSTVTFGTFTVQGGTGQFAKSIGSVDVGRLRGARLVTPSGSPVADATFAR